MVDNADKETIALYIKNRLKEMDKFEELGRQLE